ncbi:MAG TPA: c-type cytochrome [Bryobacteraceae bacterium]|nr:c-type cytochrome [Bryobacteraceae bacterium]
MRISMLFVLFLGSLTLLAQEKPAVVEKIPITPTSPASGKEMFNHYCASCHGISGKGDGPAAASFKKAPRDLTKLARDNGGKFPANHVAATLSLEDCCVHGSKVMPVWGPILSSVSHTPGEEQQRISNLVKYIETLQAP